MLLLLLSPEYKLPKLRILPTPVLEKRPETLTNTGFAFDWLGRAPLACGASALSSVLLAVELLASMPLHRVRCARGGEGARPGAARGGGGGGRAQRERPERARRFHGI